MQNYYQNINSKAISSLSLYFKYFCVRYIAIKNRKYNIFTKIERKTSSKSYKNPDYLKLKKEIKAKLFL